MAQRKPGKRGRPPKKFDPLLDRARHRLKRFRGELGLSAEDLALLLGVSSATIYQWEQGRNQMSNTVIADIAPKMGRDPGDFFSARDPGPAAPELPLVLFKINPARGEGLTTTQVREVTRLVRDCIERIEVVLGAEFPTEFEIGLVDRKNDEDPPTS